MCWPSARAENMFGLVQVVKLAASSLHSSLLVSPAVPWKVNVAELVLIVEPPAGPESIVVSGAVVSTINVLGRGRGVGITRGVAGAEGEGVGAIAERRERLRARAGREVGGVELAFELAGVASGAAEGEGGRVGADRRAPCRAGVDRRIRRRGVAGDVDPCRRRLTPALGRSGDRRRGNTVSGRPVSLIRSPTSDALIRLTTLPSTFTVAPRHRTFRTFRSFRVSCWFETQASADGNLNAEFAGIRPPPLTVRRRSLGPRSEADRQERKRGPGEEHQSESEWMPRFPPRCRLHRPPRGRIRC